MPRSELASASDLLEDAGEDASDADATETLQELSGQLQGFVDADHGPDHGRLARIEAKLNDVQTTESDDVAATIDEAIDEIHGYRETIEGV